MVARHLHQASLIFQARVPSRSRAEKRIEVGIGDGTVAYLDVNSERGSVRNSVGSPESPDAPAATVTVHARTRHGDIIIIGRAAS